MAEAETEASSSVAALSIGRIVSISGAKIVMLLNGQLPGGVQMGSLIRIRGQGAWVFGLIEGMSIPMPSESGHGTELRLAEISLVGEMLLHDGKLGPFRRGVSRVPSLDDIIEIATQADARLVYALPNLQTIRIGNVQQPGDVPAIVSTNDLLGKHFALLGTTGTGKSCGLTVMLRGILEQNPNAHVLLLDPHGEYGTAFGETAEHMSGDTLRLPYWIFNFEEIVEVVFGNDKAERSTEIMHLRDLIVQAKTNFAREARTLHHIPMLGVDTPVPYALGEVNRLLDDAMGRLDNRSLLGPYSNLRARLQALQSDRRYAFMFSTGIALRDSLAALLGRLFRVPAEGKPICIVDLAGIPSEVLNVVVAVICRMAFDFALWGGQQSPLLLVCEEAHRYAPQDSGLGFEPAKRGLARIAKEGRKYGIGLGVVSQRPSDLASSILSQCSTVIAFRMTNERDQDIIHAALSDAGATLSASLPLLGNGEALVVGEGVSVPMRMRMRALAADQRPRSGSASFSRRWQEGSAQPELLDRIVEGWRGQKPPD